MGAVAVAATVVAKAGYGRDTDALVGLAGVIAVAFALDGAVGDASVAATATVASDVEGDTHDWVLLYYRTLALQWMSQVVRWVLGTAAFLTVCW